MPQPSRLDVLTDLDPILAAADLEASPWHPADPANDQGREYRPDYDLLRRLLAVPIGHGHASAQQSGRVAKALDAYIAHELRRAGFPPEAVFPRAHQPRVRSAELAAAEQEVEHLQAALAEHEVQHGRLPRALRGAITRVARALPGSADANILGRFYVKQVDVVVSAWQRGPDVLVSSKSQFSSYLNNKNNRYEEAIGEATNLRDRYPMAAMGYAYIVRNNVFDEGAFELLRDLLVRLRRPDGPFDATVLLVAEWDDADNSLATIEDPAPALALPGFFENLLDAVMTSTPVDIHQEVRRRKLGEPLGGLPPVEGSVVPEESAGPESA
jgi:hypothetical protein